ncbi:Dyp-type peroxidase [Kitasatospora sp. NPDC051853]|uniref:Dyp-type peroxidase n=1 Tax=Kitasatospora sp. NPDC051853 TaxID=3364058 RepID=UPI0037BBD9E3
MHSSPSGHRPLPRRLILGGAAALTAGAALAATAPRPTRTTAEAPPPPGPASAATPQLLLTERQSPHTLVLAYDLPEAVTGHSGAAALRALCAAWTRSLDGNPRAALALGPGALHRLPLNAPALAELPPFPGDRLDPARSGADVLIQLCGAEGPERLAEAAAALDRRAAGLLTPRWRQAGALPATAPGETPRNLFGFKDGTANPAPAERDRIWLTEGPYAGGCHLVYRRIAMDTAGFAALPTERQEEVFGRRKEDGSPLGGSTEQDEPDLYAKYPDGAYVVPATSHVRQASPRQDGGARMLRLGYGYQDGPGDEGLVFCAYLRDPEHFVRVQRRLAEKDALSAFTEHRASAVGWVPPAGPDGVPVF